MQDDTVIDGERFRGRGLPLSIRGAAFEKRVAVGIKQRAAVGWQAHGFVFHARMDSAECGEQATPGVVAAFEAVRAACRSCHSQYKDRYKRELRDRPI